MADNTNYIGVAMGMDVTDLKAGLSEANKQIQLANSEFKAAASGMDDWTKSTEGITAKVKQLDSVLNAQKSKLAGLAAEYEKVAAEQGENSEAARKLQVQINNQQAVVNKTQKEFDNYSETLKQAEAGTIDLEKVSLRGGKAVEQMGESAEKSGEGFTVMKGVMANLIAGGITAVANGAKELVTSFFGLSESTRELRENMNKLETGFTTAELTAEDAKSTYKDLYSILGDDGQATEAAAHLAQLANNQEDLSKWTNIATGVYATFGDSLPIENLTEAANETAKTGQITGGLADALNWAGVSEEEFQAKLDAASSEQERQALITETLNGLYSEQADKFKELNGDIIAAREADAALSQAMAELGAIAEPIMTTLKTLTVDLLNSIMPFVELIGEGLTGALNGTAGATDKLAEGLGGTLNAVIGKFSEMLPSVLSVISSLIPTILQTISEQAPVILQAITNILPMLVEAILGMLPLLLTTIIGLITQIISAIAEMLPTIVQSIMTILPQLIEALIAAIPQLLQAAVQLLLAIVDAIPVIITSLIEALPSLITTIIDALIQSIPILIDAAISLLMAIVEAFPVIIDAIVQNLPTIIDAIITGILDALPLLLDAAITLFFAIIDAIPEILPSLISALPAIFTTIISSLVNAVPQLLQTAWTLFSKIIEAAGNLIKNLPSKMGQIITAIVNGLKDGTSKIKNIGKNLIEGLWNGIKDMTKWITDKLKGFGDSILSGIKKFFGIKSPSRVMRDEVGKMLGEGVGVGVIKSIPNVKKQLGKFSNFITDNMSGIKSGLTLGVSGTGTGTGGGGGAGTGGHIGGSTIINAGMTVNYNGKLSRKELKRQENDHYTAVYTKLRKAGAV